MGAMNFLRKLKGRPGAQTTRSLPEGLAVVAFGDVHGRHDLLTELHGRAASALARLRPANSIEIFLGDYVDRGPDSRRVVEWLMTSPRICHERICLRGNHEAMLLAALQSPSFMPLWLRNGGLETMRSYGVDIDGESDPGRAPYGVPPGVPHAASHVPRGTARYGEFSEPTSSSTQASCRAFPWRSRIRRT